MTYKIKHRRTGAVIHTVEADTLVDADLTGRDLRGADFRGADLRGADFREADLSGANLSEAHLRRAHLRWANLSGANLRGANLRGANMGEANMGEANLSGARLDGVVFASNPPVIENIHHKLYAAVSQPGALNMDDWHTCETTHCRAGWIVALAGEEGLRVEKEAGTPNAALAIYHASDPDYFTKHGLPDFYEPSNDKALADMKRMADIEAGSAQ